MGSSPVTVTQTSDFPLVSSKGFLDIQATTECGFTLKRVRDMIRTYSRNIYRYNILNYDYVIDDRNNAHRPQPLNGTKYSKMDQVKFL